MRNSTLLFILTILAALWILIALAKLLSDFPGELPRNVEATFTGMVLLGVLAIGASTTGLIMIAERRLDARSIHASAVPPERPRAAALRSVERPEPDGSGFPGSDRSVTRTSPISVNRVLTFPMIGGLDMEARALSAPGIALDRLRNTAS